MSLAEPTGSPLPMNDPAVPASEPTDDPVDYRTLVEQIPAITYTEVHGTGSAPGSTGQRTTFVSPQATRILGHAPQEFLEDPDLWRKLRHPGDRATVMAAERTADSRSVPSTPSTGCTTATAGSTGSATTR